MKADYCFANICATKLVGYDLKYCYMDDRKYPFKNIGEMADVSNINDFKNLEDLKYECLTHFNGLGISIQASKISAIDVDHCFDEPNNIDTANEIAKEILDMFKNHYIEFSFSGTGMRILFTSDVITNYKEVYYIKNKNTHCEFYYPEGSNRYVSITGNAIYDNPIKKADKSILVAFLETYMKKPQRAKIEVKEERLEGSVESLLRHYLMTDKVFQDNWFEDAPGSGSNESERDYYLISFIYQKIVSNKEEVKRIFETSPFFLSKDYKHKKKWEYDNYRYFNYVFGQIGGK